MSEDEEGAINIFIYNSKDGWIVSLQQYDNTILVPMRSEPDAKAFFGKLRKSMEIHGDVET
jgi:hypothetical protein